MNLKRTMNKLVSLLCCAAMLLPCIPAALGADAPVFTDGFEGYAAGEMIKSEFWASNGNNTTEFPTVVSDQAHSGKHSLMLKDTKTEVKDGSVQLTMPSNVVTSGTSAGTELIATAWYKTDGSGSCTFRLSVDGVNSDVKTDKSTEWKTVSALNTTTKENGPVRVWLVSSAANTGTIWWDDVTVSVLTRELAVQYLEEKLTASEVVVDKTAAALYTKALGLAEVDKAQESKYLARLKEVRATKGSALTWAEIQGCITDVNMAAVAGGLQGGTIAVGAVGPIPVPGIDLPAGVSAKWASVTPAGKNITVSGGNASVNVIPAGADETYTLVLRLSTATGTTVDVPYTIQLKNTDSYDREMVSQAAQKLSVIGVGRIGTVALPDLKGFGVTAAWTAVKSGNNGRLAMSGNTLSVKGLPEGTNYDEVTVTAALSRGNVSVQVDCIVVIYNPACRILLDLPNPGFEVVDGEMAADWHVTNTPSAGAWVELVSGVARTGSNSLRIVDNTVGNSMGIGSRKDAVPAKVGTEYEVTGWAMGEAKSDTEGRAGAAAYLEFSNGTTRKSVVGGVCVPISKDRWTKVAVRGVATDTFVTAMGYSYQATICDMYFDDMLLWEITTAGVLYDIDQLLVGRTTDADALYQLLSSKMLGVSGLAAANKAAYLTQLISTRASRSNALTVADINAAVAAVNTGVVDADKRAVTAAADQVRRSMTLTQTGAIALPEVSDTTVQLAWTEVVGEGEKRVRISDGTAELRSLPDQGKQDELIELTLTITKGKASTTVPVTATIKAPSAAMDELMAVTRAFDLSAYLKGQRANKVSGAIALPTQLESGITVSWQALDSVTGQSSSYIDAAGKVTRPAYGQPDAVVILRGTLTKGGESYTCDWYVLIAALGVEDAREVLAENTDFEAAAPKDKYTAPTGWNKRLKWADGKNEILTSYATVVTDNVFSGKQALRLAATGTMASIQNEHIFTAREGFTYNLQAVARTDNSASDACITIRFWNVEGTVIGTATTTYAAAPGQNGSWKNLSLSAVAPAGSVMVTAELDGGTKAGTTYFDDVRLREYPIVSNGSFDLGKAGWETAGTVSGGKLTLSAGQTAVSMVRGADRGVAYWLSLTADGGKAALRFTDKGGKTLAEYSKTMQAGLNAFSAYAPENTTGVQVVLTGAMTADDVKITRVASGTGVADGDFEHSVTGMGTPWELDNAAIAANTGKSGAGLTVRAGGKVTSNVIPTIDGKSYIFTADVKGKGTMSVGFYNLGDYGFLRKSYTASSDKNEWTTISCVIDQVPQAGRTRQLQEHEYARIVLSGEAVFDNVKVYAVSTGVSNPSVETVSDAIYGSFPKNWASYGKAAAYPANQDGQSTEGISGLAVELFGLGEGGARSSMVKDIRGGQTYEVKFNAKGSGAGVTVEFRDGDFAVVGTKSVAINSADWKTYTLTAQAPKGAVYASLAVGGTGTGVVYVDEFSMTNAVRSIGTNLQLFMDNWLIADMTNVERTYHQGEKQGAFFTGGWYVCVRWNEAKQLFEMWHCGSPNYAGYYRTSKDGIHWSEKVANVVVNLNHDPGMPGISVFIDEDEPDANKRYKAIYYARGTECYMLATSPDGINWTDQQGVLNGWDVASISYDEVNDEYVATYKIAQADGNQEKRVHSTATSKDLIHWTEGVRMFNIGAQQDVGDEFLRMDSYTTIMYPLGDSYVGFNQRFSLDDADGYGGLMDGNLLFSRDLTEDWQRMYDADGKAITVLPRGNAGDHDDAQAYPAHLLNTETETWMYYNGWTGDHGTVGVPKVPTASAIKWRKNGFISLDFAQGGIMTTKPFNLTGSKLHINAKGSLKVELLDAVGAVYATAAFSGDSVDSVLTFDKDISGQLGKVVSLRFTGSNAQLYSLQLEGTLFGDVATDAWYHRAAHYAVQNGIMSGYGGGKFGPNDTLSRAMVVQMLYNKEGQNPISGSHGFTDVPADQWFNNAVTWGTRKGVMSGYGGGKFGPNDAVTIEQIAVILWNYAGNPDFRYSADDLGEHSSWASNALGWALERGLLGNFPYSKVTDKATRAQAAQILTNFLR